MGTRIEAKVMRDRLHRMAKARGAAPPSPTVALGEIQANGGVQYAPTCWGFPDGSVLRCITAGGTWMWTAFTCDPRVNLRRHTATTHKE